MPKLLESAQRDELLQQLATAMEQKLLVLQTVTRQ